MSTAEELQLKIDNLASRRSAVRTSIADYTSAVSNLSSQIASKDAAIQAAESFLDSIFSGLASSNNTMNQSIATVASQLSSTLGGIAVEPALARCNHDTEWRIRLIENFCQQLIDRLEREKSSIEGQLSSAQASLSAAQNQLSLIQSSINTYCYQIKTL